MTLYLALIVRLLTLLLDLEISDLKVVCIIVTDENVSPPNSALAIIVKATLGNAVIMLNLGCYKVVIFVQLNSTTMLQISQT